MTDTGKTDGHNRHQNECRDDYASAEGRRELRARKNLSQELADELIRYTDDFRTTRRDRTLARVVEAASMQGVTEFGPSIAEGPAAGTLWERLVSDVEALHECVNRVIETGSPAAVRSMASWLLLDPLDSIRINTPDRIRIAARVLESDDPEARGLAAEALSELSPSELVAAADTLVTNTSERVRRHAWVAVRNTDRDRALDLAIQTFATDTNPVDVRKSAMAAIAEEMPTAEVEQLFVELVNDPNREIALAAAHLFQSLHLSPVIAAAAAQSQHEEVREIAQRLMDPYRGSPAAGGSRPGDPTGGDAFAEMLRRLGEEDDQTEP